MDEATAEAQTIVTHHGAFKVKSLQFGIIVTPGIFQELMESSSKASPGVISYFNDVLMAGASEQELMEHLWEVLTWFQTAGFQAKKCQFSAPKVGFGFLVNALGIHPTLAKVKAICSMPPPRIFGGLEFLSCLPATQGINSRKLS